MRGRSVVKKGGSASEAAFFSSDADLQTLLQIQNLQAPLFNIQEPMSENIFMSQPYMYLMVACIKVCLNPEP